jgi:hypothetical protein
MTEKIRIRRLGALFVAALASCGPGQATQPEPDVVTPSCRKFCEVADMCGGEIFAEVWQYESVGECTDYCVGITEGAVEGLDKPECVNIMTEMWDCGSSLPTCEDFAWFEYAQNQMTGLNNTSCGQEIHDSYMFCN